MRDQIPDRSRVACFLLSGVLSSAAYLVSSALAPQQRVVFSIVVVALVLWVTEVLPLYITSLVCSFLLISWGGFPAGAIFRPYFDPVIVLFMGGFVLARGMQKYGLDVALARALLKRVGPNPYLFLLATMAITAFLSMWISNTASAAIMIPICVAVLRQNGLDTGTSKFAKGCVLGVAYAATTGGIATLVGSPPNAIASRFLAENDVQMVQLTFVDWMVQALPFVVLSLLYLWVILCLINRPEVAVIESGGEEAPITQEQLMVMGIFGVTVAGWFTTRLTGLDAATVALLPVVLLYALRLLDDSDLGKINWGTLLLFGGGLSLGGALTDVGLDRLLAQALTRHLTGLHVFLVLLILVYFGILITMIISNTAAAAILIPLMLPLAKELGIDVGAAAMLIAIAVSLDFMMPVGTPPNAISYSTGLVRVRDMIRNGVLMNLGTGLILALVVYFSWMK